MNQDSIAQIKLLKTMVAYTNNQIQELETRLMKSSLLSEGIQGPQGEIGPKGDTGSKGPQGQRGIQGPLGLQGPQGEPGPLLFEDFTSEQIESLRGFTGEKGDPFEFEDFTATELMSLRGPKGEQGAIGEQGIKGEQGVIGEQGIKGDTGKDFTFDDGNATENEVAEAYGIKKEHVKYYDFIHDGNTYGFVPQLKSNAEQLAKEDGVSMDTIKSDDLYKNSDESVKADQIIKLKKRLETETKSNGQPFSEEEKNKIINMHVAKIDLGYYAENFRMQFWLEEGSEETVKLIRTQVISGSENLSSAEKANAMKHINFTGLEWDLKDTRTKGIDWNVTEGD